MEDQPAELGPYLQPTAFVDSDHPTIVEFSRSVATQHASDVDRAVAFYYAVRDGIRYDPYRVDLRPEALRASTVLEKGFGFCIPKAILLAAVARAADIPSRMGFADVKNHLATERLLEAMQTDVFAYHGYTELLLDGKWVKATPAFNASLCERFDVAPLEFDGTQDSLFQQFNRRGDRYMEYVRDRGHHPDVPLDELRAALVEYYPALAKANGYDLEGRFEEDADGEPG
jgi:transglutaminase-like putative cysteine protease